MQERGGRRQTVRRRFPRVAPQWMEELRLLGGSPLSGVSVAHLGPGEPQDNRKGYATSRFQDEYTAGLVGHSGASGPPPDREGCSLCFGQSCPNQRSGYSFEERRCHTAHPV